jgi:hypothetical protein
MRFTFAYLNDISPRAAIDVVKSQSPPLLFLEPYTDDSFSSPARIQIDPSLSRNSMLTAGRKIIAAEGPKGLLTGFGPTAVGYLVQGGAKFAGYEFWKKQLVEAVGTQEAAVEHRTAIYLVGASVAE